jgi:hypothetical protein
MDRARAPTGLLRTQVFEHGKLVDAWDASNLILVGTSIAQAQMLGGAVSGNSVAQVGFGSNQATPVFDNTSLSPGAYLKAVDAISYPAPGQVSFAISLGAYEDNGTSIAEFGLLTGNGALLARLVRAVPLMKTIAIQLASVWTITF